MDTTANNDKRVISELRARIAELEEKLELATTERYRVRLMREAL